VQRAANEAGNPLFIEKEKPVRRGGREKEHGEEEDEMQANEGGEDSEGEDDALGDEEEDKVEISKVKKTIFGDKVQVGKGCTIKFCTIGSNCTSYYIID